MLPLKENPEIFRQRMQKRVIGTEFEIEYSMMTGQNGFSICQKMKLVLLFIIEPFMKMLARSLKNSIGSEKYELVRKWY